MSLRFLKFLREMKLWRQPPPQHLGRWKLNDRQYLKVDYANMDSCGDILCGKPDHFTENKKLIIDSQESTMTKSN